MSDQSNPSDPISTHFEELPPDQTTKGYSITCPKSKIKGSASPTPEMGRKRAFPRCKAPSERARHKDRRWRVYLWDQWFNRQKMLDRMVRA